MRGLAALALSLAAAVASAQERPRLGLALGGGAARGIAHIGFLEWLEEHRVPVDRIAGTSMGGLVGGAYASGMSPGELRRLMLETDWELVFLADSPFRFKTFRRKQDARSFPAQIELGLKGGLQLPAGVNAGQQVGLLLDRIAAPYGRLESFDRLPIPFRAVATDLGGEGAVVLDSGSLALAMRATMAIPGLFTPVEMDGLVLVDGGVLNNVPADVARSMGSDVVIAVNVGSATDEPKRPQNLFDVLSQTMDVMMASGTDRALAAADLVVTPDLRGLTGLDWTRSEELADRGYEAAEAMKDELLPYSVSAEAYEEWRAAREAKRRQLRATLASIRVEGISSSLTERVEHRLDEGLLGESFDADAVQREIQLLAGTDRYEVVRYRVERTDAGARLVVMATPKRYGPPFVHPAVDLENIDANSFAMTFRSRIVFLDTFVPESEMRLDAAAGSRETVSFELYRRVLESRLFFAPRAYWRRGSVNDFDEEGEFIAEYSESVSGAGLDVGLNLGHRAELRVGYDVADVASSRQIGQPTLPEADGTNRFASLRFVFDGQTSPILPTRGVYARTFLRHYFASPALVQPDDETIPGVRDVTQAEIRLSAFRRLRQRHRLFFGASGGTSFQEEAGYNEFELGGLLRLGAFNLGELRGDNYLLGLGGALFRVVDLPEVFGGGGFVGSWLEVGSAFDALETARIEWQASGGMVFETFLGPIFLGGSVSLNSGETRLYLNVGPFVR